MKIARWAFPLAFVAVLFYLPLGIIFAKGFSLAGIDFLLTNSALNLIWFTIWQALVSALGATLVGLLFAYLLYRKYFPGQQLLRALFTVPFVLPVLVVAMAFSTFQISNVTVAIILSHVYLNAPLVARAVGSQWLSVAFDIEEAAQLDGAGRLRTFFSVTFFDLRSVIISSFVLAFAYCAAGFSTVLLLGGGTVNTIETAIYSQVFSYLNLPAATALGAVQLLLTLGLFVQLSRLVKGQVGYGSNVGYSAKPLDSRDSILTGVGVVLLALGALPIWNVFQNAFFVNATFGIDTSAVQATLHSVRNVAVVVLLCALIGTYVGYQLAHQSKRIRAVLGLAYLAPIGVSTVLVGLGFLIGFGSFRSSWLVIPLAETVLALPLVVRLISTALNSIDRELIEQAKVDGAAALQIFRFIELPSIKASVSAALGFAGIIALGDFGASSFLTFGDQETLPILLYRYFSRPGSANYHQAMFLAALFILATVTVILITSLRTYRRSELSNP